MDRSGLIIEPDAIYPQRAIRDALSISPATFAAARRAGELPFIRKGKTFLYRGEWLLSWLSPQSNVAPEARPPPAA